MPEDTSPAAIRLTGFAGRWALARRIDDRLAGRSGTFTGSATFTPDAEGLTYDETGSLTLGDAPPLTATRRYLWRQDGPRITVLFADGRAFHSFDPASTTAEAGHWCDPDTYHVTYDFAGWPDWTATWDVAGPRKDYRMVSRYCRSGALG